MHQVIWNGARNRKRAGRLPSLVTAGHFTAMFQNSRESGYSKFKPGVMKSFTYEDRGQGVL